MYHMCLSTNISFFLSVLAKFLSWKTRHLDICGYEVVNLILLLFSVGKVNFSLGKVNFFSLGKVNCRFFLGKVGVVSSAASGQPSAPPGT